MSKKVKVVAVVNPVEILEKKLQRINELRAQINKMHQLYSEHDALVEDVLPLFITTLPDQFIVRREVKLGNTTVAFTPSFYDPKKAKLIAKAWKSTAFEIGRIA